MDTVTHNLPDFVAIVTFEGPETDEGMVSRAKVRLSADSRRECTFGLVEREINEHFEENEWKIEKLKSIRVKETVTIKSYWYRE